MQWLCEIMEYLLQCVHGTVAKSIRLSGSAFDKLLVWLRGVGRAADGSVQTHTFFPG